MKRLCSQTRDILLLVALLAAAVAPVRAQSGAAMPSPGQTAPPLHLTQVLAGPPLEQLNWSAMRGEIVVVEFWATWCVPCVESIPHLDRLVQQFAGQPIHFVSITDENAALVRRFLTDHPISGWIALDGGRATMREYGVSAIPLTVIVGSDGRVDGLTRPMQLTSALLQAFLSGEHPRLPPLLGAESAMEPGDEPTELVTRQPPLVYIEIRPDDSPIGAVSVNADKSRITAMAWPPKRLLSLALDIPEDRILGAQILPPGRYTLVAAAPPGQSDALQSQIEQALASAWGVRLRRETRKMDMYLLTRFRAGKRKSPPAPSVSEGPSPISQPISMLVRQLEAQLQRLVIVQSGLEASWVAPPSYQGNDPVAVRTALRTEGLDLRPARKKLRVIVIKKLK